MLSTKHSLLSKTARISMIASCFHVIPALAQSGETTSPSAAAPTPDAGTTRSASDADTARSENGGSVFLDDIVVTATKQAGGQRAQATPIAITAVSEAQFEALNAKDIQALTTLVPNANFGTAGFSKSINLSLRGLGITSSTPSTDPAVGVFVNGVYLAVNQGVLTDTFDVSSIEVLRGPQGILFGRNVVGGAVLINNKRPTQEFTYEGRLHLESGPEWGVQGAVGGPLGGGFSARVSAQLRKDEGYWYNDFLRQKQGRDRAIVIRPSVRYQSDGTDLFLLYEHGDQQGDGPVASDGRNPRPGITSGGFRGFSDLKWDAVTFQSDFDIAFGDGTITNIFGWRKLLQVSDYDAEGTPAQLVGAGGYVKQDQLSNELRYNGRFGPVTLTTGVYIFHQNIFFQQQQRPGALRLTQGGEQDHWAAGVFGQLDLDVTDKLTLQAGARYSYEDKKVKISNLGSCDFVSHTCNYNYNELRNDGGFTPKIAVNYRPAERVMVYASAQRALRNGGYSLRYNQPQLQRPVGYDPETQDAYEIGFKTDLFDRRTRINGAVFYSDIRDLQRDIVSTDPATLITSNQTRNTADARIKGFELEVVQDVGSGFTLSGSVGHVDAKFTKVIFDLNGDRVVDGRDLALKLPRAPKWTYGAALQFDRKFGFGRVTSMITYNHSDLAYYNDPNTGVLPATDLINANLNWSPDDRWTFGIYGRNLTDELVLDANTPVTPAVCACYGQKGRVIGMEVKLQY